ncbi:MAG: hypothetical protein A4E29_00976 [Methanomassiliicoccales archaeon PtaB.Bin134]|jgi:hypothetical protein|nr:MAG: hypothetical protein A4E29_00976 [Methanomassiliicoccales archaeon PtaB.Bin134]
MRGRTLFESNWKREAKNDRLKQGERAGQLAGVILSIIVFIFLLVHWADDTGFYSSEFNEMDATVLFGPLLFGMVPSAFRFLVGRKNPSRPLDVVVSVLFVISAIYFLNYFHFNMEFFADPLPGSLEFLLDWMTEGIARIFLIIGVIGGTFSVVWTALTYVKVKEILEKRAQ